MFTNLCLVLLLLLAGSLVPKFQFQITKKEAREKSGIKLGQYNLADGVTTLAQLYALYSHKKKKLLLLPNFFVEPRGSSPTPKPSFQPVTYLAE